MQVEPFRVVTLIYELRDGGPDGPLLERMDANYPFTFLFGTDRMLPGFEAHLDGLMEGNRFSFSLPPAAAYGAWEQKQVVSLPRSKFSELGRIGTGDFVSVTDEEGRALNGVIRSLDEREVRVDFNHVMAGKTLHFQGVILKVRKATPEELIRRQYLPEDGAHQPDLGDEMA